MSGRLVVALLATGAGIGWATGPDIPPPERFALYAEHGAVQPGPDDVAPVLHIERYRVRVELTRGFRSCKLVVDVYKDGKPVGLPDHEAELAAEAGTACTLRYGVQVVDLDYLPLGGGKRNHCRMRFTLRQPDGATSALERDVPKDLIDLSQCSNVRFTERAATDDEVPLFWLKAGGTIPGRDVPTKDQVISRWSKDGSILIASLRFNAADKPEDNALQRGRESLEGTWVVASVVRDPRERGEGEAKGLEVVVKGEKVVVKDPAEDKPLGGLVIKIDPTRTPKTLDAWSDETAFGKSVEDILKEPPALGIYELGGDTLRVCWAPPEKRERPTEFASKPGSGHSLLVLRREKP
jgi:uncharacterized protein (TIGR03067 family)